MNAILQNHIHFVKNYVNNIIPCFQTIWPGFANLPFALFSIKDNFVLLGSCN